MTTHHHEQGFTLIELMIVIAIVGILATVAVPQYSQYTKRAKFSEAKVASSVIRKSIDNCYQANAGVDACNSSAATATIPNQITTAMLNRAASATLVQSVALTSAAVPQVTVTASAVEGFSGETYILTGSLTGTAGVDRFISNWTESGTGCDAGWC